MISRITTYEGHSRPVRERRERDMGDLIDQAREAVGMKPLEELWCQSCDRAHAKVPTRGIQCPCGALVWA
jgi:hypothetical protein